MDVTPSRYRTVIGATSLIMGPALMSVGDLFHPPESWAAAAQVAILAESASRWYVAHLLLFLGMLLFIPGILALTSVVSSRRARGRVYCSAAHARFGGRLVSSVRV